MLLKRTPRPVLRPFVKMIWATDQTASTRAAMGDRECVLPTGAMHLAFRLSSQPFRFFNDVEDTAGQAFGHAIVGGARAAPYVREVSGPARSVGALLHPGACNLLFGVTADELAGRHTALDELWGPWVAETRERLLAAGSPAQQLDLFESFLAARLPRVHGLHPAVAHALERFAMTSDVREVVRQTGYSHRRFIALFRQAVGLTPKLYCRVLRFQRTLERMAADPAPALVELALEAGYSDQAHFNREFREFTGLTPEEYRERSPSLPYHVPVRQPER